MKKGVAIVRQHAHEAQTEHRPALADPQADKWSSGQPTGQPKAAIEH
jgi:hypothetical protein